MKASFYSFLLLLATLPAGAQASLDQAIAGKFPLTKATADRTDIVTAGSVMDLKKDGLLMFAINSSARANLVYKDGQLQPTASTKMSAFGFMGHSTGVVRRTFVAGEKIWLIDVQQANDGVTLQFLSDAIQDVRYMASVKIPFPKGTTSSADQVLGQVSQVINAEGGTETSAKQPANAPAPPAPAPAPMAAIPPPPPPTDQAPLTLEKGQTKEQVVAAFGQPARVVKMGTKEIDYYKDMKVTFMNNKVSAVE